MLFDQKASSGKKEVLDGEFGLFWEVPAPEKLIPLEDIDGAEIEYSELLIWVTCRA